MASSKPSALSRLSLFYGNSIAAARLLWLNLLYLFFARRVQARFSRLLRYQSRDIGLATLPSDLDNEDHRHGDAHLLARKRLEDILSAYDARTGVFDGREDSSCLVNKEYIGLLLVDLHKLEANQSYKARVTLYGDEKIYKPLNKSFTASQVALLTHRLSCISSFYLEVHSISEESSQEIIFSRQIYSYSRSQATGKIKLSNIREPLCSIMHSDDLEFLYPRLLLDQPFKHCIHDVDITPSTFNVDAVITWVNNNDPTWQQLWTDRFEDDTLSNSSPGRDPDSDRFSSSDELLYSLRSIHAYLNWIRNVFIVTNCHPPSWLDLNNERVKWVHHSEIMDNTALPTFNSHAIESCLHKIPGLSEHFLYFNDDFVLLKPTSRSVFFDSIGRPLINAENYAIIRESYLRLVDKDYSRAAVNSMNALLRAGMALPQALNLHAHLPYAHRKSVVSELERLLPVHFRETQHAPLRSKLDINVMSFAAHWYGFSNGKYVLNPLSSPRDYLIVRPSNINQLIANKVSPRFACFNDGDGTSKMNSYKKIVSGYLRTRLPSRSFAEL